MERVGVMVGTLGHGKWGRRGPWNKSPSWAFQCRWDRAKELFQSLNDLLPSFSA